MKENLFTIWWHFGKDEHNPTGDGGNDLEQTIEMAKKYKESNNLDRVVVFPFFQFTKEVTEKYQIESDDIWENENGLNMLQLRIII